MSNRLESSLGGVTGGSGSSSTYDLPSTDPKPYYKFPLTRGKSELDFSTTGNITLPPGSYDFNNFTINAGHQVTLESGVYEIRCKGTFTCGGNGIIASTVGNATRDAFTIGDDKPYLNIGTSDGTNTQNNGHVATVLFVTAATFNQSADILMNAGDQALTNTSGSRGGDVIIATDEYIRSAGTINVSGGAITFTNGTFVSPVYQSGDDANLSAQFNSSCSMCWNADNTKLYVAGPDSGGVYRINRYGVTTAGDVGTLNTTAEQTILLDPLFPGYVVSRHMQMVDGDTKLFILFQANDGGSGFGSRRELALIDLSTPGDLLSGVVNPTNFSRELAVGGVPDYEAFVWIDSGQIWLADNQPNTLTKFTTSAWDLTSISAVAGESKTYNNNNFHRGLDFNADGTILFGSQGSTGYQYNLSAPYSIASKTNLNAGSEDVNFNFTASTGVAFVDLIFTADKSRVQTFDNNEIIRQFELQNSNFVGGQTGTTTIMAAETNISGGSLVDTGAEPLYAQYTPEIAGIRNTSQIYIGEFL